MTTRPSSDVIFTPAVKDAQRAQGSRGAYEKMEARGGFRVEIDEDLATWISKQRSFFLATASAAGQPYVQHRGGPPGFLRVLDDRTLAFADYRGNRQYVSMGNLSENPRVQLFLIDYQERSRVKIWGKAEISEDSALAASLTPPGYNARVERSFLIHVEAWDANCPQHIPRRLEADDVAAAIATRDARIEALEAELAALRARLEA